MSMFLVLCAVVLSLSSVYAESDELAFNEELEMLRKNCFKALKQFLLSDEETEAFVKTGDVSKIDSCCRCGYYFKKIGLLNAKGQYDLDNYMTTVRKFRKDDVFAILEELGRRCAPVKDEAVSDGEAGCERGVLLGACFLKPYN